MKLVLTNITSFDFDSCKKKKKHNLAKYCLLKKFWSYFWSRDSCFADYANFATWHAT